MRNLLIIGMVLVAASMAGWFKINREGDSTTIEINRAEIRNDARRAIDRGREILDKRDEQIAAEQQTQPFDQPGYANRPAGYQGGQVYQNAPAGQQPWNQNYGRPAPQQYPAQDYSRPAYDTGDYYNAGQPQPRR